MEQLRDIEGLDPVSVWPLSIGWWVLAAVGAITLAMTAWLLKRVVAYLRSWQRDAFKKLDRLEQNLSEANSKETVSLLSEYLRRIAVRRFPRKECAGLAGNAWLKWLNVHDPKQFDWSEKGKILIEIPYAPDGKELHLPQVKELIQAVRYWVS